MNLSLKQRDQWGANAGLSGKMKFWIKIKLDPAVPGDILFSSGHCTELNASGDMVVYEDKSFA